MDEYIKIINQAYSKDGYKFDREVTLPIINRKVTATIVIHATAPTKFAFNPTKDGGSLKFEPGIKINIPMIFIETTLTQIDFDSNTASIHTTGCPTIHIPLKKV